MTDSELIPNIPDIVKARAIDNQNYKNSHSSSDEENKKDKKKSVKKKIPKQKVKFSEQAVEDLIDHSNEPEDDVPLVIIETDKEDKPGKADLDILL